MKPLRPRLLSRSGLALAISLAIVSTSSGRAAEIKLMSTGGMKIGLIDLITTFEHATKHKVTAIYAAPGIVKDHISASEPTDVLVFPAAGLDDLVKQGKIVAD